MKTTTTFTCLNPYLVLLWLEEHGFFALIDSVDGGRGVISTDADANNISKALTETSLDRRA